MTDTTLTEVARIEADIAATRARIEDHLDALKGHLHPAELVQDVASAGLAAARKLPQALTFKKASGLIGGLLAAGLVLSLRSSSRSQHPTRS